MNSPSFSSIQSSLQKRKFESLESNMKYFDHSKDFSFQNEENSLDFMDLVILSPSDIGVCRNGGRRGQRHAPQAILSQIKKLKRTHQRTIFLTNMDFQKVELSNFVKAQSDQEKALSHLLERIPYDKLQSCIHLGGGHDCIYPFLKAIDKIFNRPITVINLDAHLDTRVDSWPSSGTPFRQFIRETNHDFHLIQVGIRSLVNPESNYIIDEKENAQGKKIQMSIIDNSELTWNQLKASLETLITENNPNSLTILSLDCDSIDCSSMEAVSAVNSFGMSKELILSIFSWHENRIKNTPKFIGIYEFNPIFDNLSQKGARIISSLLSPFLC